MKQLTDAEKESFGWLEKLCEAHMYADRLGPIRDYLKSALDTAQPVQSEPYANPAFAAFANDPPRQQAQPEPVTEPPYYQERLKDFTCQRVDDAGGAMGLRLYITHLGRSGPYQLYDGEALALWTNLGKALGPLTGVQQAQPERAPLKETMAAHLLASREKNIRCVKPLSCPKCHALWLFWPKEQSGFETDTLSVKSPTHCNYCENARADQLSTLDRVTAQQAQPDRSPSVPVLTDDELAAFLRFDETTADDQSYDIEKPMMRRLSEIGLVFRKFGAYYQTTEYGMAVLSAAHSIKQGGQHD